MSLVLAVSLILTLIAWFATSRSVELYNSARFQELTVELERIISFRMQTYINALVQTKAMFEVLPGETTRQQFRTYVDRLNLFSQYPGIQGVGYTVRIRPEDLHEHEARIRREGFPKYRVWPEEPREEYFSIIYLEPFDWRNQRAFGYDMFSEPVRREAMIRARDTAEPAVTDKVTLVQETEKERQAGFLVYVPVYEKGRPLGTVEERRAALKGFIYAPFRARDFFQAAARETSGDPSVVDYEVFIEDAPGGGTRPEASAQVYDHDRSADRLESGSNHHFEKLATLNVGGKTLSIRFVTLPAFEVKSLQYTPWAVLVAGLLLSGLLYRVLTQSRREAEARVIRRSEERLRTILESLPVGVLIADESGNVLRTNPKFREIWTGDSQGSWPEDMAGAPRKVEALEWTLGRVVSGGKAILGEVLEIEAFDGRRRTLLSGAIPIREGGRLFGAVVALQDITELKKAEETRAQLIHEKAARKEAEEGMRARNEFLSIASHELKTPLASLRLQAQMFQRGLNKQDASFSSPERIGKLVDQVDRQTSRLNRLVEDMLDIARIQSGRLAMKHEPVELRELLADVVDRLSPVMTQAGTPPTLVCDELIEGRWDRFRLEQVVTNLLTNAMRYGEKKPVLVKLERRGQVAHLSVRDEGMGITPEARERIFNRFERFVSANEVSGLGLGLYITRQIVEAHGGRIWVESEGPGKGSVFHVELPLELEEVRLDEGSGSQVG